MVHSFNQPERLGVPLFLSLLVTSTKIWGLKRECLRYVVLLMPRNFKSNTE